MFELLLLESDHSLELAQSLDASDDAPKVLLRLLWLRYLTLSLQLFYCRLHNLDLLITLIEDRLRALKLRFEGYKLRTECIFLLFIVFNDSVPRTLCRRDKFRIHARFNKFKLYSLHWSFNKLLEILLCPLLKWENLFNVLLLIFTVDYDPHNKFDDFNKLIKIVVLDHAFIIKVSCLVVNDSI